MRPDFLGVLIAGAFCVGCGVSTRPPPAQASSEAALSKPWQEARDRGVEFRAVGQEPGWFLEIDTEKQMRIVYDYGEHEAITRVTQPARHDDTTTYEAVAGAHRVRVVIDDRPCRDVMSGEAFPHGVVVRIDDRTLHGCGRNLAAKGRP